MKLTSIGKEESVKNIYEHVDYKKMTKLKENMFNQPLSYFKDKLKSEISNFCQFEGSMDKVSIVVYETKKFLKDNHIMKFNLKNIKVKRIMPKEEDIKTVQGAFDEFQIVVNQIKSKCITSGYSKKEILMRSAVYLVLKTNLIQNHPLLTDTILEAKIPFIEVTCPRIPYNISRLLDSLLISDLVEREYEDVDTELRATVIKGLLNDLQPVLTELFDRDHKGGRNPCRHCILKHKKSIFKLRVTLGYLGNDTNLLNNFTELPAGVEQGLHIVFPIYEGGIENLTTQKKKKRNKKFLEPIDSIQIYAPYIDFITDEGLFRTNTTVHTRNIYARNVEFGFDINPYWKLKHEFVLKDIDGSLL